METICNYSKLRRMNIKEERKFGKFDSFRRLRRLKTEFDFYI